MQVGIIGGGIGGVALASVLRQKQIACRVFERAPAFGEIGAGVQMTPNAVKIIRALGLMAQMEAISFTPHAVLGRNWKSGRVMWRTPLMETCQKLYGAPFLHVHRADLHDIFARQLSPDDVVFGARCTGIRHEGDKAVALFEDGSTFKADVIVGADGIHSAVRTALFGQEAARFTGHMCWRAVVPCNGVVDYVSPDSSFWLGPAAHVVTYYIRRGNAINIVAVSETPHWVDESWTLPSSREELMATFAGWHPNLQRLFSQVGDVFKWGLFDRDPLSAWSKGRVTLLGDAAHPMLPFLSQGAAMAIEDAYVLGNALAAAGAEKALAFYEAERRPRTARVQLEARKRGETYHLSSRFDVWKRDLSYLVRGLINPQKTGLKADWVYDYDATAVHMPITA